MYFDYQPTYYHLHVNVTHIKCGGRDATSIFLHSVIDNLYIDAHYYKKATLPFFCKQSHPLYEMFQKSGHIVANIGMKRPSSSQHVSAPPPKRLLQNLDKSVERPRYSTWYNAVKEYMYYFVRNHDQENRRCAVAIAPSYAVTYAHSHNADLQEPVEIEGKKHPGTIFKLFSFDFDNDGKNRKEIFVQVVCKNTQLDYVLLEAQDGAKFYESDNKHILKTPSIGDKFLCLGLSSANLPHPTHGIVMATQSKKFSGRNFMVADSVTWPGDSGGGLFSTDNRLIGIVSGSYGQNRTFFVPASVIEEGMNLLKEPTSFFYPMPEIDE